HAPLRRQVLPSFPTRRSSDLQEEMALLEERDLLFARLLQYRAFKQAAEMIRERLDTQGTMVARQAGPEPQYRNLLPTLVYRGVPDRKSTRLNSSHVSISYAVF